MSNLDNVSGPEFIAPVAALVLALAAVLAIHIAWLIHVDETNIGCVIAHASLVPGGLNTLVFTISAVTEG